MWKLLKRRFAIAMLISGIMVMLPTIAHAQDGFTSDDLARAINTVWLLFAGFLVFFMQAGFGFLEAGFVRSKNVVNIMAENFMDTTMTTIGFWAAGFGIMFSHGNGLFGSEWFFLSDLPHSIHEVPALAFFFFQFAFSAAAATIASGMMAERTDFKADMAYSVIVGLFIYPVVGHWIWGPDGWLAGLGMRDFAGSTVVHVVGAIVGLAGTILLGKRIDKSFDRSQKQIRGHNVSLSALGTFILWLGWFGFNPGSSLSATDPDFISLLVVNTDFAATTGAIAALGLAYLYTGKWDVTMAFNGTLAGLVAITAGCAYVTPNASLVIGLFAGAIVFYGVELMERLKIDDPVGAFPVHGLCGIFGTLAVGLWSRDVGLFYGGGFAQLGIQALGVAAAILFVFPASLIMFTLIRMVFGLRVSSQVEIEGIDLSYHGVESYPEFSSVELHGIRIADVSLAER